MTRLIVKEGMTVAMAGIGAGVLGAMLLARAVGSLVYAVAPRDPATLQTPLMFTMTTFAYRSFLGGLYLPPPAPPPVPWPCGAQESVTVSTTSRAPVIHLD